MTTPARAAAIQSIARKRATSSNHAHARIPETFGQDVFGLEQMRSRLPDSAWRALQRCMDSGHELDPALADLVANAMKEWAIERGATHFTHWFQPMTGVTA